MRVRFSIAGNETEVAVSDPALAPQVAALFPDSRIEELVESAPDGPLEEVADPTQDSPLEGVLGPEPTVMRVNPGPEGYDFSTREGRSTFGSVPDLLAAVEFAVVMDLLVQDDRRTHLHAAAAVTPYGAILVSGPSGAGKSSLALAGSLAGYPLFGDDVVRLDDNGLLEPFPRLLKVRPGLLMEQSIALASTPAWQAGSDEAWFDPTTAGGWASVGSRAAIVARIEYGAEDEVHVREEGTGEGLRLLLDAVQTTGLRKEQSMDRFIALLEGARVFDVRFGLPHKAARVLAELGAEAGSSPTRAPEGGNAP